MLLALRLDLFVLPGKFAPVETQTSRRMGAQNVASIPQHLQFVGERLVLGEDAGAQVFDCMKSANKKFSQRDANALEDFERGYQRIKNQAQNGDRMG